MTEISVQEYAEYEAFARQWEHDNVGSAKMVWQLLGELSDDELLVELPGWLAEEKVGYTEGAIPTMFVGRIEEETEKAIRLADATAAKPLLRLAHRIASLRDGVEDSELEKSRQAWLENRLENNRRQFRDREDLVGLREEWLPKSQILEAVRRTE